MLLCGAYLGIRRLPAYWQQSLATCEVEEIIPRLHRLIEMPPDGLQRVVDSLGSNREEVAEGAATVLNEHLRRWEKLPPHVGRNNVSILAEELARHVPEFAAPAKFEAGRLAKHILRWPPDPEATSHTKLVSYCDSVLRATETPVIATHETGEKVPAESTSNVRLAAQSPVRPASIELPGGGLPIDRHGMDVDTKIEEQTATKSLPEPGQPNELPSPEGPQVSVTSPPRIEEQIPAFQQPAAITPKPSTSEEELSNSLANQPARLSLDSDLLTTLWNRPQDIPSFELLRLAQIGDEATSERAWNEIHARDIPTKFLELGLHLTDPDPVVRRRWIQRLPALPGIDARPWLLALSNDEDAEVRMNALVLMATTGDPRLLQRIEQLARDDREPQIQDQARRILDAQR